MIRISPDTGAEIKAMVPETREPAAEESTAFLTQDFMRGQTPYKDAIHERAPQNFYSTTGGKSRIDYVYVTPPVLEKVVRAEVITDDYTRPVRNPQKISNFWHPSDHRPIVVDLKL